MGDKLLDDLARALVEPVPRSRALRLIGSVLVATSFPGTALARGLKRARPTAHTCRREDGYGDQECCSDETCCGTKQCCAPGQKCDPTGRCVSCPPPLVRCGPKCCPTGSKCTRDRRSGTPPSRRFVCCKAPNVRSEGTCRCPSGKEICNGRTCCKQGDHCSNCVDSYIEGEAEFTGQQKCCPRGQNCCGSTCVDRALTCCNGKPCPKSKPFCSAFGDCCAEEQLAIRDGIAVCCPAGTVATATGDCCPPGQESC
jgi:hypothetical protein